jgi:hypothetical protein
VEDTARLPGRKLAVGNCARTVSGIVDGHVGGCMPVPSATHVALHQVTGLGCRLRGPLTNPSFTLFARAALQATVARVRQLRRGCRVDAPGEDDSAAPSTEAEWRELTRDELRRPWVKWDYPPLTRDEIRHLVRAEWSALREMA